MKQFILILALCSPLMAQDSLDYYYEGRIAAEGEYSPSLAVIGGVTAGTLGGFIGWGIGALILVAVEPEVPAHHLRGISSYQRRDFEDGYKKAVKKKRNAAYHGGAAAGTLLAVFIVASAY